MLFQGICWLISVGEVWALLNYSYGGCIDERGSNTVLV